MGNFTVRLWGQGWGPNVPDILQLGVKLDVMVLSCNNDDHGKDGAKNHGCDADGQADEREVASLTGGNLSGYDVSTGNGCSHLDSLDDGDDAGRPEAAEGGEHSDG